MLTEAQKNNQNLLVQAQRHQATVTMARFAEQSLKSLLQSNLYFFLEDCDDAFAASKLHQAVQVLQQIKAEDVFKKLSPHIQ